MNSKSGLIKKKAKLQRIILLNQLKEKRAIEKCQKIRASIDSIENELRSFESKIIHLHETADRLTEYLLNHSGSDSEWVLDTRNCQISRNALDYEIEKNQYFRDEAIDQLVPENDELEKAMKCLNSAKIKSETVEKVLKSTQTKLGLSEEAEIEENIEELTALRTSRV